MKKITPEQIKDIIDNSEIEFSTIFEKCTLATCKLPNGFVLTETSGAVDRSNYDFEIGKQVCMQKITDQVWMLEGYSLANKLM